MKDSKKKKNKEEKLVRWRHRFYYWFFGGVYWPVKTFGVHYRVVNKLKMKKGDPYIVISNHQTNKDGLVMQYNFSRPIYFLTTDSVFSNPNVCRFVTHCFGLISKKKGETDSVSAIKMYRYVKQGGSLGIFPEGNRSYGEFQYNVDKAFIRYIKFLPAKLVLFNLRGGAGTDPRYRVHRKKGKFEGEIMKILTHEEVVAMPDDELFKLIMDTIRVYDSESGEHFKSNKQAEYVEREFFVCPVCGEKEQLVSKGNYVSCKHCGTTVEITDTMHFKSIKGDFPFTTFNEWYQYQKKWCREYEVKENETIFFDDDKKEPISLYISNPYQKRKLLTKGSVRLTDKEIIFNDEIRFNLTDIRIASPIAGTKFNFSTDTENYLVKGGKHSRFNPLKYVFMFNKLDTKMNREHIDIYYRIDD